MQVAFLYFSLIPEPDFELLKAFVVNLESLPALDRAYFISYEYLSVGDFDAIL